MTKDMCSLEAFGAERGNLAEISFHDVYECTPFVAVQLNPPTLL
ncbi:hypothetical protein [Paenibacillus sp. GSMTC-2017]|nr:hypothetical protein [Paenibacillus sp. GSMTC-2017]